MLTVIVKALYQHETDIEGDEPQTKTYFESIDSKTRFENRYNKTNKETSGEEDYIEAKLIQQRNPNRRGIWNSKRQIDVVTF